MLQIYVVPISSNMLIGKPDVFGFAGSPRQKICVEINILFGMTAVAILSCVHMCKCDTQSAAQHWQSRYKEM